MAFDFLKRLVPAKVKARIKLGGNADLYKKHIGSLENRTDYILLIGTPIHTNLGDHLITVATESFLKDTSEKELVEIPTEAFVLYKNDLKKNVSKDVTVLINGGGWMGDLWPAEQHVMNMIIETFPDNHIVILPQTVYFESKSPDTKIARETAKALKKPKNISLYVRDEGSVKECTDVLKTDYIKIAPDLALYYRYDKPSDNKRKKNTVGICLRNDREYFEGGNAKYVVRSTLQKEGYEFFPVSTMSENRISERERVQTVKRRLDLFASHSIIVTDRLHGMLFSYITGTPCIAIDNKTRKVSGVYKKWLTECDYILPCFENADKKDITAFLSYIKDKQFTPKSFEKDFAGLKEEILKNA